MDSPAVCPCEPLPEEWTISNPPGRSEIAYRVGDFLTFRRALLTALPNETQLSGWRPSAQADLALQMVEWWAYLADILTFYNERIANESYLRTAVLPESVRHLIRLLGYRPRPGIAAQGTVAAILSGGGLTLPRGFAIDSKPGPGQDPQTFELLQDTLLGPVSAVPAHPPQYLLSPAANQFLIQGASAQVAAGALLLLSSRDPVGHPVTPALLALQAVGVETTPAKRKQTRVTFSTAEALPAPMEARFLRIQKPALSMGLWTFTAGAISGKEVHLAGIARAIRPGDPVLFTAPGASGPAPFHTTVTANQDAVWYANSADPKMPPGLPAIPIPVPHSQLTLVDNFPSGWADVAASAVVAASIVVGFGWQDIGPLIDQPAPGFTGAPGTLVAVEPATFPDGAGTPILLEDANGAGMPGIGAASDAGTTLTVSGLPSPPLTLTSPLSVLYNLLAVSRGKTVSNEILGSGDATIAGMEFVLMKSPLTYLARGTSYVSTLEVRVDGQLWSEVESFYEQPSDAHVFVLREDDQQKTHVTFGDGVNGARVPTGVNNVVASYRYGSGASSPGAGQLTVISKPFPGVRSIHNPWPVGGGADPDPADQIQRYAPHSVLAFQRAVSADDYEVIAAQAPGVTRARAYWAFSGTEQRAVVTIYVGDDAAAVQSATSALATSGDPNKHVAVVGATAVPVLLILLVLVDPTYRPDDVSAGVRAALLDDSTGVFGAGRLGIGESVFHSQIAEACLRVPGAVSLRASLFISFRTTGWSFEFQPRHVPGDGAYFQIQPEWLWTFTELSDHAG